ncbi:ArnT family glycosyltransferase [Mucilaginibacter sp. McL0603]|uniref:ArnT family glycosyltransferase n=1 Tax=Mucilaginibacter sp. McL0603 TaxID=3415670 RepID=UPI003CF24FD8
MPLSHSNNPLTKENPDKAIWYFLFFWTVLNALQAYTLEIHADEAYYWLYSRFLDWGYFDHPPMVAIYIKIGDSLVHSEFGLRLMTVLSSTLSLYILWLIVKKYAIEAKWFILVVSGVFIFHQYGFTTTPDAPLFLFTALFYYIYQKYIDDDQIKWALLLGVIIACLLYSKYHGILLVGFTLLSNIKLLKRWTFWVIAGLAVILYIPHILWQIDHGYPSVNYHLYEQSTYHYQFSQTWTYFPGQLLMAGPIIGVFLFYYAFRARIKDAFTRALMVNSVFTFLFFLSSSFKGEVQPQWTLIAFAPLVLLVLIQFKQVGNWKQWFQWVAIVNLIFIVVLRVMLITASPLIRKVGQLKSLFGFKQWAYDIRQKVGDNYVILNDGFQNASKYDFYNNTTKGFAYDERYYRLTQFDIWPIEEGMQHQKAYWMSKYPVKGLTTDTLNTTGGLWYGGWVNDVRTYQKVKVEMASYKIKAKAGEKIVFDLNITNPYPYTINFSNTGYEHRVMFEACLFKGPDISGVQEAGSDFNELTLKPHESKHYSFTFVAPKEKGEYTIMFSLSTDPFLGSKNSRIISLITE